MTLEMKAKQKEKRIPFQLSVPGSLKEEFRQYVFKKHNGYKKGLFAEELEIALKNLMNDYRNDRE